LSVSRSRLKLPVQFSFLVCNASGVAVGTVYNSRTPDLYENNAHHRLGWVVTWLVMAQMLMGMMTAYVGRGRGSIARRDEHEALIPVSIGAMAEHHRLHAAPHARGYRYSNDSGQGTERASSSLRSHSLALMGEANGQRSIESRRDLYDVEDDDWYGGIFEKPESLHNSKLNRYLSKRVFGSMLCDRVLGWIDLVNNGLDRVILVLGFVAIATGVATYYGLFVSSSLAAPATLLYTHAWQRRNLIFSGLAHCVKGGIFFWYGLLTFGRWMGCFAELGWAWNMKLPASVVGSRKASVPSAEFVESFLIFLYGLTNIFLEHLAGWGQAWSAQDLEHVSIAILFFGGGLVCLTFV